MEYRQKNYLITGITGFLGGLIVKTIIESEEYKHGLIHIYGIVRNISRANQLFNNMDTRNLYFIESDICDKERLLYEFKNISINYIIHCAAVTTSSYMISNPVETADGIVIGTRNILELAQGLQIESMVYISSMEVYGQVADIGILRKEEELGEISLNSVRSCYSMGKRMGEHYCHIYQQQYGVPVRIARLAQTFGIGTRTDDTRVYMKFARAAYEKKDIILKTEGMSYGNYCASDDVISAIFLILQKGKDGEVYNVVNENNTMRIMDMANLVAKEIANGEIQVKVELEDSSKTGYAPDTQLRLSGEKLRALGWKPQKDLVQMYRDISV